MQIAVLICLISILPAILSAPDDGCPMCDHHSPLRCGPNCLQAADRDAEFDLSPTRQGDGKLSTKSLNYKYPRSPGDLLCINFPPKDKFSRNEGGIEGFVVNQGKFISLKDLLKTAHSNRYKGYDSHREGNDDIKKALEELGSVVLARGGWGKLSPPWG